MKKVIACLRVDDKGPRTVSRLEFCHSCMFPVYVAQSTPVIEDAEYRCMNCIDWKEVEGIEQITAAQVADVMVHRVKK